MRTSWLHGLTLLRLPRDRDGRVRQYVILRILTVALCAQILVTAFVTPVLGIAVAFCAVLGGAAILVRRNRRWLLGPIWLDAMWLWLVVGQTLAAAPRRGPALERPLLGIAPFLVCYLMCYSRIRPKPGTRPWLKGGSPGSNKFQFDQLGRILSGK